MFLHARRKTFPAFDDIAAALQEVWPWGEVASVEEIEHRLTGKFPQSLVEAAIWKVIGESAAQGHLLLDLERFTLSRALPLALLPPFAPPLVPGTLPDTLLPEPDAIPKAPVSPATSALIPGPAFDASRLPDPQREQFHRNLHAVELVLAGAKPTQVAKDGGIPPSTLSRLIKRTKSLGPLPVCPMAAIPEQQRCTQLSRSVSVDSISCLRA